MQASAQIKSKLFNVSIDATVNPKDFASIVFFEFETTEKELLNALLEKYEQEKVAKTQFNPNNKIIKCMRGNCCIAVVCPYSVIFNNITLLLSYLAKAEIKGESRKHAKGKNSKKHLDRITVNGKYDKMMKDIKDVSVTVVGRVARFVETLKNNKQRLDKIGAALDRITVKDRDDLYGDTKYEVGSATVKNSDDTAAMYMAIVLADVCCHFTKSSGNLKISFSREGDFEKFKNLMRVKERIIFQTQVRSFLTQSGTIGGSSSGRKGADALARKIGNIMNSENALAHIYAKLKGISYKFKDKDDIRCIDNEALSTIMKVSIDKQ